MLKIYLDASMIAMAPVLLCALPLDQRVTMFFPRLQWSPGVGLPKVFERAHEVFDGGSFACSSHNDSGVIFHFDFEILTIFIRTKVCISSYPFHGMIV